METILCYFFSTIPQVLAGAIGLLGVFCLYKLNLIDHYLQGLTSSMAFELKTNPAYKKIIKKKFKLSTDKKDDIEKNQEFKINITELKKHIRRLNVAAKQKDLNVMKITLDNAYHFIKTIVINENMSEKIIEPFEKQIKNRNKLIKYTKYIAIYTGIVIFVSILIIPFIKQILTFCPYSTITTLNCFSVILLIVVLILFLINLVAIISIIYRTLAMQIL